MKLHANARTCPKSRRLIVKRVDEQGWSLAAAAEAAGVSERTAAQVARPLAAEGSRPPDRSSRAGRSTDPHPRRAGERRSRPCEGCG